MYIDRKDKIMKIKTLGMEEMCYDGAEATAYKGIIRKREIATIGMNANFDSDEYQIEFFRVREEERNKGIGSKLLNYIVNEAKKCGCKRLVVYPNSESYEGDKIIEPQCLYTIYEHLGFKLEDSRADRTRPNNKMILKIDK